MDRRKRPSEKTDKLIDYFTINPTATIHQAAGIIGCTKNYAGEVKRWIKGGKIGPIKQRGKYNVDRKYERQKNKIIEVRCLGNFKRSDHTFLTEAKRVGDREIPLLRICPICAAVNTFNSQGAIF